MSTEQVGGRDSGSWSYVCPMCLSPVPHEIANTECRPSGSVPPPVDDGLALEMEAWDRASTEAYWLVEDQIGADPHQGGDRE